MAVIGSALAENEPEQVAVTRDRDVSGCGV